eukprot:gb/GEZN01022750.1/.p1 GENE.gb/GEZN01022750.1/~~gb/GEZN01022750.1/.p1  ORF type:complete len:168 (+),score=26.86 gb/GEZN01022750.1/:31-504(+)
MLFSFFIMGAPTVLRKDQLGDLARITQETGRVQVMQWDDSDYMATLMDIQIPVILLGTKAASWPALKNWQQNSYIAKKLPKLPHVEKSPHRVLMFYNSKKAFTRYAEIQQQELAKTAEGNYPTSKFLRWAQENEPKKNKKDTICFIMFTPELRNLAN